ncbi:prephenate/arogenate dehydrogenase [Leptothoe kymatousa]|uniref:prephenate/arogenate dehydrogenase n=1 Tax=Leptothoe kymatousa TaxID=2651727 RepID=UPI001C20DA42|nr:prephenate/arogenate dehydrogenase [Leptothoe kymatousa]
MNTPTSDKAITIGIVGLGLIGGCLALDLQQLGYRVYGVTRREATAQTALEQGFVTRASCDLALMGQTDVVFVCTPMAAIVPTVGQLAQHLSTSTVVTDVGSVKAEIVAAATALWPNFVGGHPMAGKAEAGLAAAEPGLFDHRPYVVTPIKTTRLQALAQIKQIATQLNARLYTASPTEHDHAVAAISHLPVMVSASLLHTCFNEDNELIKTLAQNLASSGFCDTSRVGGGNPDLGTMMAQYNRTALLKTLQRYRHQLDDITQIIEKEDWDTLNQHLSRSQQERPHYL